MSLDENKSVVRSFLTAMSSGGNIDTLDELVATNYVNRGLGNIDLAGFKEMLSAMPAASDVEIKDLIAEGDAVVVRSAMTITLADGKKASVRAITYYRLADGRIVEDDTMTSPDLSQILADAMLVRA